MRKYIKTTISIDGGHHEGTIEGLIYDKKSGNLHIEYVGGSKVDYVPNSSAKAILQSTVHTTQLMGFITHDEEAILMRMTESDNEKQLGLARTMLAGLMKEYIKRSIDE